MDKRKWTIVVCLLMLFAVPYALNLSAQKEPEAAALKEDRTVYKNENPSDVKEVYITVFPLDEASKKYTQNFEQLNQDTNYKDDKETAVKVLFQEGKDGSPKQGYFGYGLTDTNGVMTLRGQSARSSDQKSYKVVLNKKGGLWTGYKVINLNKHPFDSLRIRNKLSYDLLKTVPDVTSLRTNFVHVYIKDYSNGDYSQVFKDYGLFTHVENVDNDFLKSRGLDPKGSLYKVENFEFFRYPEELRLNSEPNYDEAEFEKILEIKGNDDHTKLLKMLEDVNNRFIHINEVIRRHFDRENYITWLAVNILFDNFDTSSRNYFLYSPSNSNTWYLLPWDYDGAWRGVSEEIRGKWQQGASNYWGVVLHRRFLENRENVKELSGKIDSLAKIFTNEKTGRLLDKYQPIITRFLTSEPDARGSITEKTIYEEISLLRGLVPKNRQAYYKNLESPMPVFMAKPYQLGGYNIFKWTESQDLQGDKVEYSLDISTSPKFDSIIYHKNGIRETEQMVNHLPKGKYYWRLNIKDSKGNTQIPFDIYVDKATSTHYFGVQQFHVL